MVDSTERFLESIELFKEDFRSLEIRMVAFRWQTGWVNLSTRALLSTSEPAPVKPPVRLPTLPNLKVEFARLDFNYLYTLMRVFQEGSLSWKDEEIMFRRVEGPRFGKEYSPSFRSYSRHSSQRSLGIDTRCLECLE